ncbi:protein phosphatase CheZ [Acuticoccus sp. I52.16.1]|uniref:protein phosphatase CheZ n=1 Tax=Acuticoccus sp. I52.16.1 TaxID=2928472 RepID=UPI001FD4A9DF|nr:protein phosphatase CheZ [Acuticoccus sp. I52.16.1]UOM35574.1 protein phosphatase CheZ [Acuticoccus sp. I52.16.1]
MARPFRVEIAEARRLAESSPMTHQVETILKELHTARGQGSGGASEQKVDNAIALWSGVDDIQKRIDVTKTEIGALYARSEGDQSNARAADELRAVVEGTEMATDTILAAAETIDTLVAEMAGDLEGANAERAQSISNSVIQIFEACNFQDITGQRISKVVASLSFIEERIASMVDVWKAQELTAPVEKKEKTDKDLLNGPALDGDYGVVNQDDVDALFG